MVKNYQFKTVLAESVITCGRNKRFPRKALKGYIIGRHRGETSCHKMVKVAWEDVGVEGVTLKDVML